MLVSMDNSTATYTLKRIYPSPCSMSCALTHVIMKNLYLYNDA
jgi:hypothetical protein